MMNILLRIYSIFFYIAFLVVFLIIFPFHVIFLLIRTKATHDAAHFLNTIWGASIMYPFGIIIRRKHVDRLDRKQTYVFCPNHTTYLDIPFCNVSIPHSFRFIGKAELTKAPLFGFMFGRLHIAVDRAKRTQSFRALERAQEKLKEGTSILIFPEGTIPDKEKVDLLRFKDGAFRMAIESGTPLVPMTILNGPKALADNGRWLLRPTIVPIIFHEPIPTTDMTLEDVPALRQRVFDLMEQTLREHGALLEQRVAVPG